MSLPVEIQGVIRDPDPERWKTLLMTVHEKRRHLLLLNGDLINARLDLLPPGRVVRGAFWRDVASHLGCSAQFVRDLSAVSRAFDDTLRERFAEPNQGWAWMREVCRIHDGHGPLLVTAESWAGASTREIRECRTQVASGGGATLKIRLTREEVQALVSGAAAVRECRVNQYQVVITLTIPEAQEGDPNPERGR